MEQLIYVRLLDEGTNVYRPVKALKIEEKKFKILDQMPEHEIWEYKVGDIVDCEYKDLEGKSHLVAVKLTTATQ